MEELNVEWECEHKALVEVYKGGIGRQIAWKGGTFEQGMEASNWKNKASNNFRRLLYSHVKRNVNSVAHNLAKHAIRIPDFQV